MLDDPDSSSLDVPNHFDGFISGKDTELEDGNIYYHNDNREWESEILAMV